MRTSIGALFLAFCATTCVSATAQAWTLVNPTDETYVDEPVRLKLDLPDWAAAAARRLPGDARPGHVRPVDYLLRRHDRPAYA